MNLLVSACLMGLNCRYNGLSVEEEVLRRLEAQHTLIPFCPEIYGGLPTPREPCEIRAGRVYAKSGADVTAQFERGAREALKLAKRSGCRYAILQERSPSCGHGLIHDGGFAGGLVAGDGVTAALLEKNGVRVINAAQAAALFLTEGAEAVPGPRIVSLRERPDLLRDFIAYFQARWASKESMMVYEDCMTQCLTSPSRLPQWYLLFKDEEIVGCAGLIANDFISRMDLWPWLCALLIEPAHRGHAYGALLLQKGREHAAQLGFDSVYLCTDHVGYYERYGFEHIGTGYHPWGEASRIYRAPSLRRGA